MVHISKNIQEAITKNLRFHVITSNEVHSFMKISDAIRDKEDAELAQKEIGITTEIECLSQEKAIAKYGSNNMEKYIIRNNSHSVCINNDGDYVVEADDKCINPIAEFDTIEEAEKVLKHEISPVFVFDPLVVTKIEAV